MLPSLFDMSGKHIMITGGGTGLGRQFALTLSEAGAHLTLAARRIENLEATAAEIRTAGGRADCLAMDVSDATSVELAFAALRTPCLLYTSPSPRD